jgi:hypothetical protein
VQHRNDHTEGRRTWQPDPPGTRLPVRALTRPHTLTAGAARSAQAVLSGPANFPDQPATLIAGRPRGFDAGSPAMRFVSLPAPAGSAARITLPARGQVTVPTG